MSTITQSHLEAEPEYVAPTINDVRYGWGLSMQQLTTLLSTDTTWEYFQTDQDEDGGQEVIYKNTIHGYWQGWSFDQAGQMQGVSLYIPPGKNHIVGAFLVGATWLGDSWIYLQDALKNLDAERLQVFQGEYTEDAGPYAGLYSVLKIKFIPPYRGT